MSLARKRCAAQRLLALSGLASAPPTRRSSLFRVHRISAIERNPFVTRVQPQPILAARAECPPNTKMSSLTSQSSSTMSASGPPRYLLAPRSTFVLTRFPLFLLSLGLGNYQGRIRRPGSSKMFFPLVVCLDLLSARV
jgi:hypothetical protein